MAEAEADMGEVGADAEPVTVPAHRHAHPVAHPLDGPQSGGSPRLRAAAEAADSAETAQAVGGQLLVRLEMHPGPTMTPAPKG